MIKELSDALRALINSLSMRPLATITAVFIIFAAYIGYRSYDTLQQMIVTPHEESNRFKAQLASAALVNDAIEKLNTDLGAHSVIIKQFHNGRHDLTGIPFTEATSTFYTSQYEGVSEEPLSALNKSLTRMWQEIDRPECITIRQGIDNSTSKYFREYKLNRVVICPLTNLLNYPIGTITVGFNSASDTVVGDVVALQRTSAIAKRITGYLEDGDI
jgi:hypothetical protein